jgi:hypothetical protein
LYLLKSPHWQQQRSRGLGAGAVKKKKKKKTVDLLQLLAGGVGNDAD